MLEEKDKQGHFIAGAIAAISVYLPALLLAFNTSAIAMWASVATVSTLVFVALLGWAKEHFDSKDPAHHTVDFNDWLATMLGGVAGVAITGIVTLVAVWAI